MSPSSPSEADNTVYTDQEMGVIGPNENDDNEDADDEVDLDKTKEGL